ncbi:MAG TPA: hemin uptake protein HemP [Rhizomicrobium sp.]|jgi:hemin uptake protein HemP|nr:hemin uptake protein HemP [Rhizomicrobium sp.]
MTAAVDAKPKSQRPAGSRPVPRIPIDDLLAGGREAVLLHDGIEYRLRLTSNGKLILTK